MRQTESEVAGGARGEGGYEVAWWALVIGIALAMRLAKLDAAPLSAGEARRAIVAWQAAAGQGVPVEGYSPLLLAANSLLFVLVGASDALARFWPALFGSALALTPALFRRHLGRRGAVASGLYLAISPTLLVASRQLDGTAIAAAGAVGFVGGLTRFLHTDREGWLTFAAVSLSLAVTSGAAVHGLLLPLALAWVVLGQLRPDGRAFRPERVLARLRAHAARFFLVFALSSIALATGLGWNASGMAGAGGLVADWFRRFQALETRVASPAVLLLVYESFGVVFGLGGLIWGLRRGQQWAALMGLWAGLGALLLSVMPGRTPTDLTWVVVPLAMLVGPAVRELVRNHRGSGAGWRAAYSLLALVLWAQVYLMLGRYTAFGERADLGLVVIVAGLQLLLALTFALVMGSGAMFGTAGVATGVALVALTVSTAWGVAYGRPADPREVLVGQPTAVNVRDLAQTLRDLSWQETGMPTALDLVYEVPPDSVVVWYLRNFEMARRVDHLSELDGDELEATVVTVGDRGLDAAFPGGAGYVGQSFPLRRGQWTPDLMGCRLWDRGCGIVFEWLLFRDGPSLPDVEREAILWRQVELSEGG